MMQNNTATFDWYSHSSLQTISDSLAETVNHQSGCKEFKPNQETGSISSVINVFILVAHICSFSPSMYLFRAKTGKGTKVLGLNPLLPLWYAEPPTASRGRSNEFQTEELQPTYRQIKYRNRLFNRITFIQYTQWLPRTEPVTSSYKAAHLRGCVRMNTQRHPCSPWEFDISMRSSRCHLVSMMKYFQTTRTVKAKLPYIKPIRPKSIDLRTSALSPACVWIQILWWDISSIHWILVV